MPFIFMAWVQKNAGSPSTLSRRAAAVSSEELKEQQLQYGAKADGASDSSGT